MFDKDQNQDSGPVLTYEFLAGSPPFDDENPIRIMEKINNVNLKISKQIYKKNNSILLLLNFYIFKYNKIKVTFLNISINF